MVNDHLGPTFMPFETDLAILCVKVWHVTFLRHLSTRRAEFYFPRPELPDCTLVSDVANQETVFSSLAKHGSLMFHCADRSP
jgi:hypothetical protein